MASSNASLFTFSETHNDDSWLNIFRQRKNTKSTAFRVSFKEHWFNSKCSTCWKILPKICYQRKMHKQKIGSSIKEVKWWEKASDWELPLLSLLHLKILIQCTVCICHARGRQSINLDCVWPAMSMAWYQQQNSISLLFSILFVFFFLLSWFCSARCVVLALFIATSDGATFIQIITILDHLMVDKTLLVSEYFWKPFGLIVLPAKSMKIVCEGKY